ncbi:DUF3560 domain-containing protein [Micromonospora tulbaghiae]|uniref:DUF3560 domain-containing protein n=1 Tax=Micromonospora tulbaghiae TaxID=479978 RepID=UPI0033BD5560
MLTISHTHADGTTLNGSRKGDGVWEVCKANGWAFSRNVGIYLRQSRDKDANRARIDRTAEALRAAGHDVTVDIDNTPRPTAERETDRAERADRRAARYAERAGKADAESQARRAAADAISDRMPFGEPIKIGHHSERSHRRAFEKIHAHTEKSWEAADKARELSDRAEAVGHNLAHRQDPRVTMRRIERLEVEQRKLVRDYGERAAGKVARLTEEIEHWRAELAKLAESGEFVPWGPEHFRKGDAVNVRGTWYPVVRVNRKSVSVPPLIGLGRPNGADGQPWSWTDTVPWDDLGGRRRDGMQLDTPNGEAWPVDLAQKVARWEDLARWIGRDGRDEETRREALHVRWAQRLAHGLDLGAGQSEVQAFQPHPDDTDTCRALAAAYLAVFERLQAGESTADIAASLPPMPELTPAWVLPDGEPQRVQVREVKPGDMLRGVYQMGGLLGCGDGMLSRSFCGPVAEVIPHEGDEYSGERFVGYWVVVLSTGERREFKPWQPLAVHRAEQAADATAPEPAAEAEPVAEVKPTAAERWQALEAANGDRPGSRATQERIRRQSVAWHRVHGVADDHVGSLPADYPGGDEERAAALLAAYAALLAADGIGRTHPAEPEPTPDAAPLPAVTAGPSAAESDRHAVALAVAEAVRAEARNYPDQDSLIYTQAVRRGLHQRASGMDAGPVADALRAEAERWPDTHGTFSWSYVGASMRRRADEIVAGVSEPAATAAPVNVFADLLAARQRAA